MHEQCHEEVLRALHAVAQSIRGCSHTVSAVGFAICLTILLSTCAAG